MGGHGDISTTDRTVVTLPVPALEKLRTERQGALRDGSAKSPAPPTPGGAANPETSPPSIGDSLGEPDLKTFFLAMDAPLPESAKERELNDTAQKAIDALFSGDATRSDTAKKALQFASPELLNRVSRKINERMQAIVRASTNTTAGAPRVKP